MASQLNLTLLSELVLSLATLYFSMCCCGCFYVEVCIAAVLLHCLHVFVALWCCTMRLLIQNAEIQWLVFGL